MIFYEAPHKLRKTLSDLEKLLGKERRIALCRELTKVHEEVWRTTLGEGRRPTTGTRSPGGSSSWWWRGQPPPRSPRSPSPWRKPWPWPRSWRVRGSLPARAAKEAARQSGLRRGEVYAALIRAQEKG